MSKELPPISLSLIYIFSFATHNICRYFSLYRSHFVLMCSMLIHIQQNSIVVIILMMFLVALFRSISFRALALSLYRFLNSEFILISFFCLIQRTEKNTWGKSRLYNLLENSIESDNWCQPRDILNVVWVFYICHNCCVCYYGFVTTIRFFFYQHSGFRFSLLFEYRDNSNRKKDARTWVE